MLQEREHKFEDGVTVRLLGDSLLVQPDPPQTSTSSGLIHFADGSMEHVLLTGTILAMGYKELEDGTLMPLSEVDPELKLGRKIVFVRFLKDQQTNLQWSELFDGAIRLRLTDVMLAFDEEDEERILR